MVPVRLAGEGRVFVHGHGWPQRLIERFVHDRLAFFVFAPVGYCKHNRLTKMQWKSVSRVKVQSEQAGHDRPSSSNVAAGRTPASFAVLLRLVDLLGGHALRMPLDEAEDGSFVGGV